MLKWKSYYTWVILLVLTAGICWLVINSTLSKQSLSTVTTYVGSASCISCHSSIHNSFSQTAHYKTSSEATSTTIKGTFVAPNNEYEYNRHDKMLLEKTDSGFYQTGFTDGKKVGSQRFDIVIGSGTKGQTYLHWVGQRLVQLPVSYYTSDSLWASSPGYPPDRFLISRPITGKCLNCHSTYFNVKAQVAKPDEFDKLNILFGVDCERCHGPASRHVDFHISNPKEKVGRYIIQNKSLSRKQQLHACAQCHSSSLKATKAAFAFFPGDSLYEDFMTMGRGDTSATAEVHGNQYDLLTLSKCFLKSDSMTCSTCHNTHANERGNLKLFSARCQSCHQAAKNECKLKSVSMDIQSNCIDCHMPENLSTKISFRVEGKSVLTKEVARTHFVKVYPAVAKKLMEGLDDFLNKTHAKE